MIIPFKNYLESGKVKRKTPDSNEAIALFEKAQNRLAYAQTRNINEKTAQFVLEDSYEALREATQALMSLKGLKPYSHEATISFLKEYYSDHFNEEELYKFDRFRQLRNDSVYKAIQINIQEARSFLSFANKLIRKIKTLKKTGMKNQ